MENTKNLGALIKELTHAMATEFDRRLKVHKITLAQWGVLRQLWEREGRSQVELQSRLSLEGSTVSGLLQRMLRADLILRQPDPVDKRVQRIFLTPGGRDLQPVVAQLAKEVHDQTFAGFTEDEQLFLSRLLTRALHNVERS